MTNDTVTAFSAGIAALQEEIGALVAKHRLQNPRAAGYAVVVDQITGITCLDDYVAARKAFRSLLPPPHDLYLADDYRLDNSQLADLSCKPGNHFMGEQEPFTAERLDAIRMKMAIKGSRISIPVSLSMAIDPLLAQVPVHHAADGMRYVNIGEIPEPWRSKFIDFLYSAQMPVVPGVERAAYVLDWASFLSRNGRRLRFE